MRMQSFTYSYLLLGLEAVTYTFEHSAAKNFDASFRTQEKENDTYIKGARKMGRRVVRNSIPTSPFMLFIMVGYNKM